ncbi:ABC transporter ATP-binding protein [Bacillus massiliigorillae]|uniref:ABC transporter ATP-binding protein n=1 Tax=Bacillus massiliigorillae TaxID=1243664 RepID=UPI0003A60C3F|nr:ABC transporter ATP-binding protein [Bacillus massiliigorillae]
MINVENVIFSRNNKDILKNVSWSVNKGEHWCLLGLNGSGKTTLLNVINGYIWPMKGKVEVLGNLFGQTNIPELRKEIGWVSSSIQQKFNETDTVLEVVLSGKFASIGLYEHVENNEIEHAKSILRMLNCEKLQFQNYGVISQGERQRVLIARALMSSPKLLILDEPCNGLDLIAREQLLKYIEKIAENPSGPTLIYVTHHVEEILPCFTHSLLMREGEVFSQGATQEQLTEANLSSFFQHPVAVQVQQNRTWIALKEYAEERR